MYNLGAYSIIFIVCWAVWLGFWLVVWNWSKPAIQKEKRGTSLLYKFLITIGFVLIISDTSQIPVLNFQLIPHYQMIMVIGAIICVGGLALTIWARSVLAGNWSAGVELKVAHQLIQKGPYRVVRHPIYSGLTAMFFGATLAAGTIASILGIIFGFISFVVKLKEEERLLTANLGQEYPKYKTSTWAVIPFIY